MKVPVSHYAAYSAQLAEDFYALAEGASAQKPQVVFWAFHCYTLILLMPFALILLLAILIMRTEPVPVGYLEGM